LAASSLLLFVPAQQVHALGGALLRVYLVIDVINVGYELVRV
jgi:hypothetical protein